MHTINFKRHNHFCFVTDSDNTEKEEIYMQFEENLIKFYKIDNIERSKVLAKNMFYYKK